MSGLEGWRGGFCQWRRGELHGHMPLLIGAVLWCGPSGIAGGWVVDLLLQRRHLLLELRLQFGLPFQVGGDGRQLLLLLGQLGLALGQLPLQPGDFEVVFGGFLLLRQQRGVPFGNGLPQLLDARLQGLIGVYNVLKGEGVTV